MRVEDRAAIGALVGLVEHLAALDVAERRGTRATAAASASSSSAAIAVGVDSPAAPATCHEQRGGEHRRHRRGRRRRARGARSTRSGSPARRQAWSMARRSKQQPHRQEVGQRGRRAAGMLLGMALQPREHPGPARQRQRRANRNGSTSSPCTPSACSDAAITVERSGLPLVDAAHVGLGAAAGARRGGAAGIQLGHRAQEAALATRQGDVRLPLVEEARAQADRARRAPPRRCRRRRAPPARRGGAAAPACAAAARPARGATRASAACHSAADRDTRRRCRRRTVKARPAASSPSQSATSSVCHSRVAGQPGEHRFAAARRRARGRPRDARRRRRCARRAAPRGTRAGSDTAGRRGRRRRPARLVERQVLEGVQRVVVDEHADRPLVGQHAAGARERAVDRVVGQSAGAPHI